jgi:hypothetical protein
LDYRHACRKSFSTEQRAEEFCFGVICSKSKPPGRITSIPPQEIMRLDVYIFKEILYILKLLKFEKIGV